MTVSALPGELRLLRMSEAPTAATTPSSSAGHTDPPPLPSSNSNSRSSSFPEISPIAPASRNIQLLTRFPRSRTPGRLTRPSSTPPAERRLSPCTLTPVSRSARPEHCACSARVPARPARRRPQTPSITGRAGGPPRGVVLCLSPCVSAPKGLPASRGEEPRTTGFIRQSTGRRTV